MEKLVPKLRFPEFEGNWIYQDLKSISDIYDGTHQTPKYVDSGIPFVSVENINDIYNTDKFISKEAFEKEYKIKPKKDDILMTRITAGIIGATSIVKSNTPLAFYVSLALIRLKNNDVLVEFLNQRINTSYFKHELHRRIIHIAFPKKINLGEIGLCKISYPLFPEQQKIATFLISVDERIILLEKQKQGLETYKKGVMQQLFSQQLRFKDDAGNDFPDWEGKKLGEVSTITTGSSNRQDSGLDGEFTFFDRSEDIRTSNIYLFDTEAIIVAGEGSDFKPKYFIGKFDLHQRSYAIMNFKNSTGKFLFYYIHFHRNHFLSQAVGSTVKSLRLPMFQKMEIKLPCLDEQQKIASFLSAIDARIDVVSKQIEQSKVFKKGLLQQLFV